MARINIEDDIEGRDEFWKLLEILKSRDLCLGKLVRFFRIAQRSYAKKTPLTQDDLDRAELGVMIETGWALPVSGGFQALGADAQFAWYAQKVEAGRRGGRPKKEKTPSNENSEVAKASGFLVNRNDNSVNPPAPAPALSPTPNTIRENLSLQELPENWHFQATGEMPSEIQPALNQDLSQAAAFALSTVPSRAQIAWLEAYPDPAWIRQELLGCLAHLAVKPPRSPFTTFGSFFGNWLKNNWKDRRTRSSQQEISMPDLTKDPFESLKGKLA